VARDLLRVESLPVDIFLCWFGLHALTPDIFNCLEQMERDGATEGGELQLTGAQAMLSSRRTAFGLEIKGDHFDTGSPRGYVEAVAAFAGPRV
jgi:UTP--glucose-1-phosphate uridylyltransferase